jgi:uncharacterized protein (TIGR00251 family)
VVEDLFETTADGSVLLRLHVQPGAGRTAVVGRHGDALKVRVAAPPQGGRANDACAALLAGVLGVSQSAVELTSGAESRSKRFRIDGLDAEDVRRRLELALAEATSAGGGTAARGGRRRGWGRSAGG